MIVKEATVMHENIHFISVLPGTMAASLPDAIDGSSLTLALDGKCCKNELAAFHHLKTVFQFPSYFGSNWAATDECLCDLEWLPFSELSVRVDNFPDMLSGDPALQALFLSCIEAMVRYWESNGRRVEVWVNLTSDAPQRSIKPFGKWDRFCLRWVKVRCPYCGTVLKEKVHLTNFSEEALNVDKKTLQMLYPEQPPGAPLKNEWFSCESCHRRYTLAQARHIQRSKSSNRSIQELFTELFDLS